MNGKKSSKLVGPPTPSFKTRQDVEIQAAKKRDKDIAADYNAGTRKRQAEYKLAPRYRQRDLEEEDAVARSKAADKIGQSQANLRKRMDELDAEQKAVGRAKKGGKK